MRFPRVRFSVMSLMIVVAVVGRLALGSIMGSGDTILNY